MWVDTLHRVSLIAFEPVRFNMALNRKSPGPAAAQAFRLGIFAGAVLGLVAVGALYWAGMITLVLLGYTMFLLFPVYLVMVAVILSRWLGYDKDVTALRPVHRPKEE